MHTTKAFVPAQTARLCVSYSYHGCFASNFSSIPFESFDGPMVNSQPPSLLLVMILLLPESPAALPFVGHGSRSSPVSVSTSRLCSSKPLTLFLLARSSSLATINANVGLPVGFTN